MIVEDNEPMRRMIRLIVADLAERIDECDDGAEACACYADHRPDWVLMDIQMGDVDGIEATRRIISDHPGAKVVIVTDYDDADLRTAAAEAGACGYVLKEDLLKLRQLLIREG
ncbi:MAG: response regulator transcription factor [Acidobacteriota bacterium]|nr:response regulator transcription factor [Acidobacteriota bacterium]